MTLDAFAALRAIWSPDLPGRGSGDGDVFSTAARAVYTCLVMHADDDGRCYPSHGRISRQTDLGRSTVIRALAFLESAGWITRRRGAPPAVTHYRVIVPERDHPTAGPSRSETLIVPERDFDSPTAGHELPIELPIELPNELDGNFVSEIWTVFVAELGGNPPHPKLTPTRRKLLRALHDEQLRHHESPADVFLRICKAVKASDHHMSKREYQMPESLFRNEERRERWTMAALDGDVSATGTGEKVTTWDESTMGKFQ